MLPAESNYRMWKLDDLLHPKGNSNIMNPLWSSRDNYNMATAVIQSSASLSINNMTIHDSAILSDINPYSYNYGVDVECNVVRATGNLVAQNFLVENSCIHETYYSQYRVFNEWSAGNNYRNSNYNYQCDGVRPNSDYANLHRLTTLGDSSYNTPERSCRLHSAIVAYATSSISLTNYTVVDSAKVKVHFSQSSGSDQDFRHATAIGAVVFSEGGGEIDQMNVVNSGNASVTSAYSGNNMHLNSFSYIVALEGNTNSVLYVNNSDLNHSSVTPSCSQSYWDAQHWYAIGVGTGTVVVTDTNISEISSKFLQFVRIFWNGMA